LSAVGGLRPRLNRCCQPHQLNYSCNSVLSAHTHTHTHLLVPHGPYLSSLLCLPLCFFGPPPVLIRTDFVCLGLAPGLLLPPLTLTLPLPALTGVLWRLVGILNEEGRVSGCKVRCRHCFLFD
jgi:hypothetical protein